MAMEYSSNQRGGRVLIYLGFEYLLQRTTNDIQTWRCRENRSTRCRSFLKIKNDAIYAEPTVHCHDSCPQKTEANIAKIKMKQSMLAVGANPRNVIKNVLTEVSDKALVYLPKMSSLARNLSNHRIDNHMPNPVNLNFAIPEMYDDLVLYDSGVNDPERILVLGNKDLINELTKDMIIGDGAFDEVPTIYYQLYTWYAQVGNTYPPCLYFLLSKKSTSTYTKMFDIMKILLPDLNPQKVLIDFEKVCMNAARIAFPHAEMKGCYFHLSHSLIRKINSVGLKTVYESNLDHKLKLKSLAALALVPIDDVKSVFNQLATTFPEEEAYSDVLSYFFYTYIEGAAGRNPQFPITLWNHYDPAMERSPETTNYCEGYHNTLNSLFHCIHPSVWFLFDGLRRDLACHMLTLANANSGREEIKNKKYEKIYKAVSSAVREYEQTDDKIKYLENLANWQ